MALLDVSGLKKIYTSSSGGKGAKALENVSFSVENGEFIAIMGESGSGKTTLMQIIATLDKPTSGQVLLNGKNLSELGEKELANFRRDNLGFVFQDFRLLDNFTVKDNILLPLVLADTNLSVMMQRLEHTADTLEISHLLDRFPHEISGGQKQRVAVARAIITQPRLILADEPTGALDSLAAARLLNLFEKLNNDGQTILMVTHSIKAACCAKRVLFIKDGVVFHQLYKGEMTDNEMYQKIADALTLIMTGGERRGFPTTI